ncbi:MAG TPA: phosphatase PAP2 family protein [Marmoricola sp.]|nr:phosphatase PAP2 family protein [Marmoricola sp.]
MGVATVTGVLAVAASLALDLPIRDPDGFLGPSWVRLPGLCLGAFLADVIPRSLWRARRAPRNFLSEARAVINEHWTRDRITLVILGLVGFYVTYVGYRNLKSYLPFIREGTQDSLLRHIDEFLAFGSSPAILLHQALGEGISAHVLSFVYLFFLPFVPISLVVCLVWSRNISFGYWYATAQCLCWALGTASYYMIPSLGPTFAAPWLYADLANTAAASLQDSLFYSRSDALADPVSDMQGVAGFASLHVALVLCATLLVHYTVRHVWVRWSMWVFTVLTVLATIYFGWHYIADDVAGALIALISVWLGGLATGQRFERRGRSSSPTTSTTKVPVDQRTR